MARRGAARLGETGTASAAWRAANEAAREDRRQGEPQGDAESSPIQDAPWQPESWVDEGVVRDEAEGAVRRGLDTGSSRGRKRPPRSSAEPARGRKGAAGRGGSGATRPGRTAPGVAPEPPASLQGGVDDEVAAAERAARRDEISSSTDEELKAALGATKGTRAQQRMRDAGDAFRRGRFEDARRILRPLAESAPRVAGLRELYGLTLYRLGRWKQAATELEAFRTLTSSVDQHPVLADCYRALGRHDDVEALWEELRTASPSAELVAEGRIVAAGALADRGRMDDALALLAPAIRPTRRAKPHHLRVAYALADLYERAGDLPRARELFQRVAGTDPDFVDVRERLAALR